MYGLGGGFGGSPYQSPAGALANGIEGGIGIIQNLQAAQDRRDQVARQNARQDRLDQIQQAHDEFIDRNTADKEQAAHQRFALEALASEKNDVESQLTDIVTRHGGDVKAAQQDPDWAAPGARRDALQASIGAVHNAIYAPYVQAANDAAKTHTQVLQSGDHDPAHPDNADATHTYLTVALGDDPAKLLPGADGGPSTIQQQVNDMHDAFASGDMYKLGTAAQNLWGNHINTQLGGINEVGHTITNRSLNPDQPFVPTPDGTGLHPVIQSMGEGSDGSSSINPMGPPASDHHDDESDLNTLKLPAMADRLGRTGALAKMVSASPDLQTSIASHGDNPPQESQDYAHAATAVGFSPKYNHVIQKIDGKGYFTIKTDRNGNSVGAAELIPGTEPDDKAPAKDAALEWAHNTVNPTTEQPYVSDAEYGQKLHDNAMGIGAVSGAKDSATQMRESALARLVKSGAYSQQDADRIAAGITPKEAGPNEGEAKEQGSIASERELLAAGYHTDPVMGVTKVTDPEQLKALTAALNAKSVAHNSAYGKNTNKSNPTKIDDSGGLDGGIKGAPAKPPAPPVPQGFKVL